MQTIGMLAGVPDTGSGANGWPSWALRHLDLRRLGAPGAFFASVAICIAFVTLAYVGIWNAQKYPVPLGYDAQGHTAYADVLIQDHRLPTASDTNEYHQPPGYYAVAGEATRLGERIFHFPKGSYRGAQYLNVLFVLATAAILLALARMIAPGHPSLWAASLLFFAFLPVVSKTEAMFHPENLNMLLSTVALLLTTKILIRHHLQPRLAIGLALTLAGGLLVRSSTLFTVLAVGFSLGIVLLLPKIGKPHASRRLAATVGVAIVVIAGAAAIYQTHLIPSTPDLGRAIVHPLSRESSVSSRSSFFQVTTSVFTSPFRPNYANEAFPTTYTEIWGDWFGAFSWSAYSLAPWAPTRAVLKDQSWIGVLPTLLAIAGWLLICWRSLRRSPQLLAVALLPLIAVIGYLYRSYLFLSPDGDLFKASYVLTTAPVWALCFGVAYSSLRRFPLVRAGIAICLLVFAVLELRFMLYGIRDHRPIF